MLTGRSERTGPMSPDAPLSSSALKRVIPPSTGYSTSTAAAAIPTWGWAKGALSTTTDSSSPPTGGSSDGSVVDAPGRGSVVEVAVASSPGSPDGERVNSSASETTRATARTIVAAIHGWDRILSNIDHQISPSQTAKTIQQ